MKRSYFSHDRDARSDPKIIRLRALYGMEGYGVYFALLEMLASETSHRLPYDDEQFAAIAFDLRTEIDIKKFLNRCISLGLFEADESAFWSGALLRRLEESEGRARRKSEQAASAAAARWGNRGANAGSEPPPESLQDYDQQWLRVVRAYEGSLGLFPTGRDCEKMLDYYQQLGADVIVEAVAVAEKAAPEAPAKYLLAILAKWAERGVDTLEKAKAAAAEHKLKAGRGRGRQQADENPLLNAKFY